MDPAPVIPEDPRTFNRYSYAYNNPYRYVDPDGRIVKEIIIGGGLVAAKLCSKSSACTKAVTNGLSKIGKKLSGKNPPINKARQKQHTDGTPGKSQFKKEVDPDKVVEDAWQNGKPKFNKNGKLIGKVKQYKNEVGTDGQKSVDVRFSKKKGIHGFPSNKTE